MTLQTCHTVADLRSTVSQWRKDGLRVALVPTMGALHAGHISLTERARSHADLVIVSIFVNPTQFGANEDFGSYPRTLESDQHLLAHAGVDLCFAPSVEEMYPQGFATKIQVDSPMTRVLCGAKRPGHFDGVAQIVTKLLLSALPDCAIFGEKDFQQLSVIRRFCTDLSIPATILGGPIHREADGLAMSSRNRYLTAQERSIAPVLYRTLCSIAQQTREGTPWDQLLDQGRENIIKAGFTSVDYLQICDEESLMPLHAPSDKPARLFVAAYLGKARLIDNCPL